MELLAFGLSATRPEHENPHSLCEARKSRIHNWLKLSVKLCAEKKVPKRPTAGEKGKERARLGNASNCCRKRWLDSFPSLVSSSITDRQFPTVRQSTKFPGSRLFLTKTFGEVSGAIKTQLRVDNTFAAMRLSSQYVTRFRREGEENLKLIWPELSVGRERVVFTGIASLDFVWVHLTNVKLQPNSIVSSLKIYGNKIENLHVSSTNRCSRLEHPH